MSRVPIVFVLGATGTGKSKLAIELAKKFNGEVVSADSMQVYQGLDIASNKITQSEMEGVPHHMLDVLRPMDRFSVTDFRNQALPIVEDILKRKKLPIVVGGTNYYIESLIYQMLVEPLDENAELIANRCLVLKDASQINHWKTYKGSILPQLRKNETEKNDTIVEDTPSCDISNKTVTKDDINPLIERVKSIEYDFRNSIKSILDTMNLTYRYYKTTFYPIGFHEKDSLKDDLTNIRQPADTDIVDILHLETRIMKEYINDNLKHMTTYLSNKEDPIEGDINENFTHDLKDDMDLDECYLTLSQSRELPFAKNFSFLNCSRFWNLTNVCSLVNNSNSVISADYNKLTEEFRDVCKSRPHLTTDCYLMFRKFVECVIALTTVRIKRLNLIRIVDEVALLDFNNEELYAELRLLDTDMKRKIHPNNRRKVIRALQTYFSTGETMGQFQKKQHQLDGACEVMGPLRYPDACLLWICCDQLHCRLLHEHLGKYLENKFEHVSYRSLRIFGFNVPKLSSSLPVVQRVCFEQTGYFQSTYMVSSTDQKNEANFKVVANEVLNARLTERVDEMMERGLIDELLEFHKQYNIQRLACNLDFDYSRGIFQSIGLKEFHSYLIATDEERDSDKGQKLLKKGIEMLNIATVKYSKYQAKYIMNKFIKVPETKKVPPIFKLDGTNLDQWHEKVEKNAFDIVENYLNGSDMLSLDYTPLPSQTADPSRFEDGEHYCEACDRLFIGTYQWKQHYQSKRHRSVVYNKKVNELKKKLATLKMPTEENRPKQDELDDAAKIPLNGNKLVETSAV